MRVSNVLFVAVAQAAMLSGPLKSINGVRKAASEVVDNKSFSEFMDKISAGKTPNTPAIATKIIQDAIALSEHNPASLAGLLRLLGLTDTLSPSAEQLSGCGKPCTYNNTGNREISTSVYAQSPGDAPWDIPEKKLRAAMYFPPAFTHGKKMPVLMVPGTGNYGQQSFVTNFGKKFKQGNSFDPVYLNVQHYLMDDIQDTAEYIAYALKYIHAMTNTTVAAVTWSQGAIAVAWTLQYWPSLRNFTSDVINLSANYKGTESTYLTCPLALCGEALWQQRPNSQFLKTLKAGGGDSAWVPTTSIMSLTDDVVLQTGDENAAGFIMDARNAGATNTFVQNVCAFKPGGIPYTHEGIMLSSLAFDLTVDALLHDGPGQVSRLNLEETCSVPVTLGLSILNVIHTMGTTLVAAFNIGTQPPTDGEPPIKPYARI